MKKFLLATVCLVSVSAPLASVVAAPGATTQSASNVGPSSEDASPLKKVSSTIDKVVEVVQAHPGNAQVDERRQKLRQLLDGRFDFEEMAKRSLGTNWTKINSAQRQEFISLFSDLLARTYLSRIDSIEPGMVSIDSERVQDDKAIVRTTVRYKGDTFPIHYRLLNDAGEWKVYDVIIENIGLVANYRNEFAGILRREGMNGLLQRLRDKGTATAES